MREEGEVDAVSAKVRYILQYLIFPALPISAAVCAAAAFTVYYASCHRESGDALPMSVFLAVIAACTVGYYIIRIVGFSRMIRAQSRKYGVDLDDAGAVTVSGMFPRVICGRMWLIQPCRLALYRGHIQKASVTERIGKGGVRYAVRIKTVSGKIYNITFTNEKLALRVRDYLRGKHIA